MRDEMGARWPWWRLLFHMIFLRHESTNWGQDYPSPVCRTCELAELYRERQEAEARLQRRTPSPAPPGAQLLEPPTEGDSHGQT